MEALRERPETFYSPSGVGTHGEGAVGVARSNAFTPAGVTNPTVWRDLFFPETVLGSLAGDQRARLKLRSQLGVADNAVTLSCFI